MPDADARRVSGSDRPGVGSLMLTTQARDAAGATVPTGTRAEPYGGGRRTSGARPMRRRVTARRGRKGGNARQGGLNGGVGRGRSRCCRAVLALAGLSGAFAYIVPTQPQLPIPLNPVSC